MIYSSEIKAKYQYLLLTPTNMKTTDYKLYSYKMKHDNRFAPNPLLGVLTLATCKTAMRRNTKIGNWIAGWTSKQLKDSPTEVGKEKLVYLAKVTQKLSFAEYWEKYEQKRPVKTEDTKVIQRYGDNIYKPNPTNPKEFIQIENNFHGKDKMDKDLRGEYVLICEEFYYFSRLSPLDIPDGMRPNIPKVQTSYGVITKDAAEFINYVKQHVELCKYTDAK